MTIRSTSDYVPNGDGTIVKPPYMCSGGAFKLALPSDGHIVICAYPDREHKSAWMQVLVLPGPGTQLLLRNAGIEISDGDRRVAVGHSGKPIQSLFYSASYVGFLKDKQEHQVGSIWKGESVRLDQLLNRDQIDKPQALAGTKTPPFLRRFLMEYQLPMFPREFSVKIMGMEINGQPVDFGKLGFKLRNRTYPALVPVQ
jgi:hypothetical protein